MGRLTKKELEDELAELRLRLEEAEDTLSAIRQGEVDALLVSGPEGEQIYTLRGADHTYRMLVENINEGAATLTQDGKILFANRKMGELLKTPLEKVIGACIQDFIYPLDKQVFARLFGEAQTEASKGEVRLKGGGAYALFSLNRMPAGDNPSAISLVATDLSQPKRQEKLLHYLTEQYTQARGEERRRLAGQIHEGLGHELLKVKQSLKSLGDGLEPGHVPIREPVNNILRHVDAMIDSVWKLYHDLTPKDLETVGLTGALDLLFTKFRGDRGLKISVEKDNIQDLFPPDVQITIHRVLQEVFNNLQKYCQADEVKLDIKKHDRRVDFTVVHRGQSFEPDKASLANGDLGPGLMAVDDWITVLGGEFSISKTGAGNQLVISLPVPAPA
jgi:PAS domain S-box-containing protein